jgi:DNA polymerase III subunit delta'
MFDQLLLHDKTKEQIDAFLRRPSHALLITGQPGSGKENLGQVMAAQLLGVSTDKLSGYPYYTALIKPSDKQEISIDSVRQVINSLKLKPAISQKGQAQKLVFINDAHLLSEEAQNALLKLIEEPPPSTAFILTAPSDSDILPTIASRVQKITVVPVSLKAAQDYFKKAGSGDVVESAWSLSQGAAGLTAAILEDDQDHPLKKAVDSAKSFLKMDQYERVLFLDGISNRADLLELLDALNRILTALHQTAIKGDRELLSNKLINSRKLVISAIAALNKNTSTRLIGLDLALHLQL